MARQTYRFGSSLRAAKYSSIASTNSHAWRRRLSEEREPVRFALVETGTVSEPEGRAPIELVLTNGERLRIAAGVSAELLRTVLGVLRG